MMTNGNRWRRRSVPNDLADRRHVGGFDAAPQRISQEPFRHCPDELILSAEQHIPESGGPVDPCSVRKSSGRIDTLAPSAQAVEIFERIAERIHARVATRTRSIGLMKFHALPHREIPHILVFLQGWDIRRRWRRR